MQQALLNAGIILPSVGRLRDEGTRRIDALAHCLLDEVRPRAAALYLVETGDAHEVHLPALDDAYCSLLALEALTGRIGDRVRELLDRSKLPGACVHSRDVVHLYAGARLRRTGEQAH